MIHLSDRALDTRRLIRLADFGMTLTSWLAHGGSESDVVADYDGMPAVAPSKARALKHQIAEAVKHRQHLETIERQEEERERQSRKDYLDRIEQKVAAYALAHTLPDRYSVAVLGRVIRKHPPTDHADEVVFNETVVGEFEAILREHGASADVLYMNSGPQIIGSPSRYYTS